MENYTVGNINNDFLSQSYSQSIERIAGTKDHIFNFQIPKKLLEVRKKAWVNLFGKYSEEMSDDIELNVDTLEPDEEEKEKEVSVKEYSCGQRIPMRKSATLIQYWINTGNPPYKAFLDENELSETGASLSEKEITLSLYSSIPNVINNEGNKQEFKNIELCSMSKEYIASKTYDQPTINIVTTGNTIQPNMYSQSCEKTDKMNVLSTSQRSLDIQSRDDIVRQFDQTSKRLTGDGENNSASNQDEVLEKDTFCKKGMSEDIIAQEIITKDTSLTALYRKKLYTEEKDGELSSLKNTDISQNKESYSTTLEELPPRLSVNEDCTNVKSREIKVILEQSPSAMESQSLKKDDTVRQNNVSNKSKTFSSNSYGANKIGNVRFREIKVILERLPVSAMESQILNKDDIVRQNNVLNKSKTLSSSSYGANKTAYENVEASIQTVDKIDNYSLRMHTKSKEYNDPRISDTSDNVAEHQIFDKTESDSLFQYKNHSKVSQGNDNKYSVLSLTSSDEDDFVRLIQRPKKRLKFSKNDKLLDETNIEKNLCDETNLVTNKDKCYYSRNLSTVIFSSKEAKTKEIFESIKERKGSNRIEIKSFDNTASLQMCKNGKFLFSSNESDNDSVVKNLDKRKKRASFLNYNKSINNNNERHSNAIVKRNGINYKDDTGAVFFQTKMFNTDSSDSEESNSYTAPTRKAFKNSFVYHKSQYYNHAHLEESFNDSIAKRYSRKHSSSLHSSFEKHNITNRIHDIKVGLGSTSKKAKISKQLANEEFNDNINSRINNTRKNMSPSSFINDTSIRDTTTQKEMFSSSLGKNNFSSLSKNKQISDKFKNSAAIQQDDVKSTKLLMFQTKTYYDSDSNESL
ncbi:unnamed protein product [Lasius platythorax]|uniref:Uncharacterized protein n=1 Tax=Lasius platythorax TaxID=488582 RepID=A0AAV2NYL7_9HYME